MVAGLWPGPRVRASWSEREREATGSALRTYSWISALRMASWRAERGSCSTVMRACLPGCWGSSPPGPLSPRGEGRRSGTARGRWAGGRAGLALAHAVCQRPHILPDAGTRVKGLPTARQQEVGAVERAARHAADCRGDRGGPARCGAPDHEGIAARHRTRGRGACADWRPAGVAGHRACRGMPRRLPWGRGAGGRACRKMPHRSPWSHIAGGRACRNMPQGTPTPPASGWAEGPALGSGERAVGQAGDAGAVRCGAVKLVGGHASECRDDHRRLGGWVG